MYWVFPFNENIFTEIDFLAANVTDRPIVDTKTCVLSDSIEVETASGNLISTSFIVSPEIIQPHIEAKLRKVTIAKRRKGKSPIFSDTSEMKVILQSNLIMNNVKTNEECPFVLFFTRSLRQPVTKASGEFFNKKFSIFFNFV